jgi:glycosyltransferase involved in cell wall biosynthesis
LRAAGIGFHAAPRPVWLANGMHLAVHRDRDRLIHGGGVLSHWLRRTLARLARQRHIDVVHVHGCRLGQIWLAGWAAARSIAFVYTEHVAIADFGGPMTADAPQLAATATLACVSEHSRASLAALLGAERAITVTGHIVALPEPVQASNSAPGQVHILCPARLVAHKGIDVLITAFAIVAASHPGARLVLAGSGTEAARLQQQARAAGIADQVNFFGAVAPDAMMAALQRADIVVLPSRTEGLPMALLEAMATAKPLVATRVGGIPEFITHNENGLLVESDDPPGLAAAIVVLAGDAALRQRLGAAARRSFEASRHHASRVIPEMLNLYRAAMA